MIEYYPENKVVHTKDFRNTPDPEGYKLKYIEPSKGGFAMFYRLDFKWAFEQQISNYNPLQNQKVKIVNVESFGADSLITGFVEIKVPYTFIFEGRKFAFVRQDGHCQCYDVQSGLQVIACDDFWHLLLKFEDYIIPKINLFEKAVFNKYYDYLYKYNSIAAWLTP